MMVSTTSHSLPPKKKPKQNKTKQKNGLTIPRYNEHFLQIRLIEVSDISNPRYNELISPVPWHLVKSRFHWTSNLTITTCTEDEGMGENICFSSKSKHFLRCVSALSDRKQRWQELELPVVLLSERKLFSNFKYSYQPENAKKKINK